MKLIWSGLGFLIPVITMIAFLVVMVALPAHMKDDFWVLGSLAAGLGIVFLPIGLLANRGEGRHHFWYIPMQYWGGLFLLVGIGLFVAEGVTGMGSSSAAADEGSEACAELGQILRECPSVGPAAGMLQMACEASDPAMQTGCLECVQASGDACNPSACRSECDFQPPM